MRLEQLVLRLSEFVVRDSALDHHFALATIFEVMDVGARADLKSDVLKDLDKQKHLLDGYRNNPAIAAEVLDKVFNQVDRCFSALNNVPGKAGQSLTENDWLMSIRSRIGIPGGTCAFDDALLQLGQPQHRQRDRFLLHLHHVMHPRPGDGERVPAGLCHSQPIRKSVSCSHAHRLLRC